MPLFLLRYMSSKFEVVGFAIVEAKDSISLVARLKSTKSASRAYLRSSMNSIRRRYHLIGCRLSLDDVIINKPPAPSVRRRPSAVSLKLSRAGFSR
jgi:hypothetical protein